MARKPTAPRNAPELPVKPAQPALSGTSVPVRRERKPKAAAAAPEPMPATSGGGAEAEATSPILPVTDSAPARGRGGRKARQKGDAATPSLLQEALEQQPGGPGPDQSQATEPAGDDAMIAEMAYPVSAGGDSDIPAGGAAPPSPPVQGAAPSAEPAAHWDGSTDTVRFDWAEIERTAAQAGPNQVMAKLLVAARAEGANSRWPL